MFIVFTGSAICMQDIFEEYMAPNVMVIQEPQGLRGWLYRIHHSISLNMRYHFCLKGLWYPFVMDYKMLDKRYMEGEDIFFVFFEGNRLAYQKQYLSYLRKRYPKSRFIFRYINIISPDNERYLPYVQDNFHLCITFDQKDAKNYHMLYVPNTYWHRKLQNKVKATKDVIFLGGEKGRIQKLFDIAEILECSGLSFDFYIAGVAAKNQVEREGFHYISNISYSQYINMIQSYRALLELRSGNQVGYTLRTLEAVWFNKKLIIDQTAENLNNILNCQDVVCLTDSTPQKIADAVRQPPTKCHDTHCIEHQKLFMAIAKYFSENEKSNKI